MTNVSLHEYRDSLINEYKNVDKSTYLYLLGLKKQGIMAVNISDNIDLIYQLYWVEQIGDSDIGKLCGLTKAGMQAKRRRLGIKDRPSEFDITLRMTQEAMNELGFRA